MFARALAFFAAVAGAACVPEAHFELPDAGAARSMLLIVRDRASGSALEVRAFEAPFRGSTALTLIGGVEIFAVFYEETLAELQLDPPAVRVAAAGSGRALPRPAARVFVAEIDGQRMITWSLEQLDSLSAVRIDPPLDLASWADAGNCLDAGGSPIVDCPRVEPELPDPPIPPRAPPPSPPTVACLPGAAQFHGGAGCERIGSSCGEWPELDPGERAIYVKADAPEGGGGTIGAPHRTLAAAIVEVEAGMTVAIAPGTYRGRIFFDESGVRLAGACAESTVLDEDPADPWTVLELAGAGTVLENLTIRGGSAAAINVSSVQALLRDVAIEAGRGFGIAITDGASAAIERSVIRGRALGGITVTRGDARGVIADSVLEDNGGYSLACDIGSISIFDTRVTGLLRPAAYSTLLSTSTCATDLHRVLLERSQGCAIGSFRAPLAIEDAILRTAHGVDLGPGWGLCLQGQDIRLTRVLIEDTEDTVLQTINVRSAVLEDVYVRGLRSVSESALSVFAFHDTDHVRMDRVAFEAGRSSGVLLAPVRTASLTDVVGHFDLAPDRVGLSVADGSNVRLTRAAFLRTPGFGIYVAAGATAVVSDVAITGAGVGIRVDTSIAGDACLAGSRLAIDVAQLGIDVELGGGAALSDVTITSPEATDFPAINFQSTRRLGLSRFVLDGGERRRRIGLSLDSGTARPITTPCPEAPDGVLLSEGLIRGHQIGVTSNLGNIELPDLLDRIRYEDNDLTWLRPD